LLPVKLAMNLVRRYNEADLLAASPSGAQAGTDMWANAMKKERQRKKSKTHMLLRDEPNGEVDLAIDMASELVYETQSMENDSLDLTTVDIRQISAACGVTDGRFIDRRFRGNDISTHRRSSSGGEGRRGREAADDVAGGGGAADDARAGVGGRAEEGGKLKAVPARAPARPITPPGTPKEHLRNTSSTHLTAATTTPARAPVSPGRAHITPAVRLGAEASDVRAHELVRHVTSDDAVPKADVLKASSAADVAKTSAPSDFSRVPPADVLKLKLCQVVSVKRDLIYMSKET
jgi:hypothetical protein